MNTILIVALAETAKRYARAKFLETNNHGRGLYSADVFERKFAELIVQECMTAAEPNYVATSDLETKAVEEAIERISTRFEVEAPWNLQDE